MRVFEMCKITKIRDYSTYRIIQLEQEKRNRRVNKVREVDGIRNETKKKGKLLGYLI